ncbi:MAG TPA: hypothetical protein VNU71_19590, partial [Burkholderiaceae bacterium]|nr:hypothetical protein [Burkholderiaceae bacterium]
MPVYTLIHVVLSLVGIFAGLVVVGGFPFVALLPSHLYLNVFVLLAQLLQKTPALALLAPNPQAPAFAATQGLVLVFFVGLGWAAVRGFGRA